MDETNYYISNKWHRCIAVLADIHARRYDEFLPKLYQKSIDYIFVPGDFVDGKVIERTTYHEGIITEANNLLNLLSKVAPTFYSLGNHEKLLSIDERKELRNNNAFSLFDEYRLIEEGLVVGGLSSGRDRNDSKESVNLDFLDEYDNLSGFKILLCHHPEYYIPYLKEKSFDLVISGHAHGGQVRIGNQGLFAPGQGLFPKYTSGIHHGGKQVISRGIAGTEIFPRINNQPEIVYLHI